MPKKTIKIIHNAPKKKGKLEVRQFDTIEEAAAYVERNASGGRLDRNKDGTRKFPGR